jgi:vancomycin permeability regulator SanA
MNAIAALHPVHSLSVLSADSLLRERQILMLQQAFHNARVVTLHERLTVVQWCTGRPVTSLREVRQSELRPILAHVRTMATGPRGMSEV